MTAFVAKAMAYPVIPCDICGGQEGLQVAQVKKLRDSWEEQFPGRRQVMFRALMTVRPSHLADPELFDLAGREALCGSTTEPKADADNSMQLLGVR